MMERRSEPRYPADEPAKVTILGSEPCVISGRVVNLSGKGMRLMLEREAPVGAPVRVDVDGTILLGEVCYCARQGNSFCAGLELEHALTMSEELASLMRGLMEETRQDHPQHKEAHNPNRF